MLKLIDGAAESSHHVVPEYAGNDSTVLGDFKPLNPILNDASAYMLSVLRFG